ncbi:MAG TPA: hypothetical protein VMR34_04520 [Candidatus Saccharimonadales bacterium]|nr:hypothetical protein [Candidatus Saccharimonadales bacterium]
MNLRDQKGSSLVVILLAVLVVGFVAADAYLLVKGKPKPVASAPKTVTTQPIKSTTQTAQAATSDEQLDSINQSLNTENSDQTATNQAINDQQNEITVPTN